MHAASREIRVDRATHEERKRPVVDETDWLDADSGDIVTLDPDNPSHAAAEPGHGRVRR